jgi:hypothetical protein
MAGTVLGDDFAPSWGALVVCGEGRGVGVGVGIERGCMGNNASANSVTFALPERAVVRIASYLTVKDILSVSKTSHMLNASEFASLFFVCAR